jgi:hypothetical protein
MRIRLPGWGVPATIGSVVVTALLVILLVGRTPGFSVVGLLGGIAVTVAGGGVAGAAHYFARRLIARRPWGAYLYGVLPTSSPSWGP